MKILLVEDELFLSNSVSKKLSNQNISIDTEYDGRKALNLILENNYDLVILDIMLPQMDGLTILQKVRESKNDVPIILTSAKGEIEDKVKGLEMGADDYLAKPYEFIELFARIKSHLRRKNTSIISENASLGNIKLERNTLTLLNEDNEIKLTLKEFNLLEYLITSSPNTISKEQIIDKIWDNDADVLPNHVEVYISYLRKKLKLIEANIQVNTIRGVGYQVDVIEHV